MLADNNYNASALFWYTQRYHAEPRTEVRVPLASGARSDWGLLGVFRSLDGANRPWGSPAYRAVRLGPRALFMEGWREWGGVVWPPKGKGYLAQFIQTKGPGPWTPNHGSCASSLEHWPFSVRVVDSLHGGLFAAIKFKRKAWR